MKDDKACGRDLGLMLADFRWKRIQTLGFVRILLRQARNFRLI